MNILLSHQVVDIIVIDRIGILAYSLLERAQQNCKRDKTTEAKSQ